MNKYRKPVEGIYTRKLRVESVNDRRETIKLIVFGVIFFVLYVLASTADVATGAI